MDEKITNMISNSKLFCPICKKEDHQKVIFLGSEFSYRCINCSATHCFVENPYWDFTDNFKEHGCGDYKWKLSRYVGTVKNSEWSFEDKDLCLRTPQDVYNMKKLRVAFEKLGGTHTGEVDVDVVKISEKRSDNRQFFVANAVTNHHFQECFRAVVRMKDHTSTSESKSSYNILIIDKKMDICLNPVSKLDGVDEIWRVKNWSENQSVWHVSERPEEIEDSLALGNTISKMLDGLDGKAMAISKGLGPCRLGKAALKELLFCEKFELRTTKGHLIEDKHVGILVRNDSLDRAGFESEKQIREVCKFVDNFGFKPLLIACTEQEEQICKRTSESTLSAKNLQEQVVFYEHFCLGVIGTNGSGCNIPCLFDLPLLSFAKSRFFPDDFYCMGRLSSPYDCSKAFGGELSKPESVVEIRCDPSKPTSIMDHLDPATTWIKGLKN